MTTSTTPAIEVSSVSKIYRGGLLGRRRFQALDDVSLQVAGGEIFGLLGPNGAGKTTLIKVLLGIIRCDGGNGTLLGQALGSRVSRRRIGYLPENLTIARHHNALSALQYYGGLSGVPNATIRQRRDELLELVGLADRRKTSVKEYSKGMRQRLGLAQALLHDPDLLILDEPTDGLDPVGRNQIRSILDGLKTQGKTVFLNSHILQEVELICDRVAILNRGQVKMVGNVSQLSEGTTEEYLFDVATDEPTLLGIMGATPFAVEKEVGGLLTIRVELGDQSRVDALIDKLRESGISIAGIGKRKRSLEDLFLDVVGTPAEADAV